MYFELTDSFEVTAPMAACWEFFTRAENLPRITPPWLRFTIAMPQPLPAIVCDATLDYTIRWMGVPVRWRTRIIDFSPAVGSGPGQFIDLQIRGPYTLWHHQHRFEPIAGGEGVRCFDRVLYQLPFGLVGQLTHALMVRRQLVEIFRFRRRVIGEALGWSRALQDDIAVCRLR